MGVTVEQQHEKLAKRYQRQEAWRKGYYSGYQSGIFLSEYGLSADVLTIEPTDTKKDIANKNKLLRDLTKKGGQKLIVIDKATENNRFISERRYKEADRLQSKINYENYKLYRATLEATKDYKYKNKQGVIEHRQITDLQDIPKLPGLAETRGFYIKGHEELSVGYRIPSSVKAQGEGAIIAYESFLYNRAKVPVIEITTSKITNKYKTLFGGKGYATKSKDRLKLLKKNFMKALETGKNAIFPKGKGIRGTKTFLKEMRSLSGKDILYLMSRYEDIFDFGYIYSQEQLEAKLEALRTVVENYKQAKTDKDNVEYKRIKAYEKNLGNIYD